MGNVGTVALAAALTLSCMAWAGVHRIVLVDPHEPVAKAWEHRAFGPRTAYENVRVEGVAAIRASGQGTASGLYRRVAYRPREHPWVEWTWRVDRQPASADIRRIEREDFAAAIYFLFGRPGLFNGNVPGIAYVWTSDAVEAGAIVHDPRHAGWVRKLVLESGDANRGRWLRVRRNLLEDYRRLFGSEPPELVEMIALWTDSDQTGEPVDSLYGGITATPD